MIQALFLMTMFGSTSLQVGDKAPDFSAVDIDGQALQLSVLIAHGPVVLAFYPKAFTSVCTQEMASYTGQYSEFKARSARVIAISGDYATTLKKFKADLGAEFSFIADPDGVLMKLFQVKYPFVSIAKRRTFVINSQGIITHIDEGSDAANTHRAFEHLLIK